MITGAAFAGALRELRVSHLAWLPDSLLGTWERDLVGAPGLQLVRVCREGEAWGLAAGLFLGGAQPVVAMQSTGLFESGDALRNVLCDMQLPLWALVGYRSFLVCDSRDTARRYAEPILAAWGLAPVLAEDDADLPGLVEHFRACRAAGRPAVALIAEGRG